jgi:hypothetical protein
VKEGLLFLKKNSKSRLDGCRGLAGSVSQGEKFFGSFFQKRTAFLPSSALLFRWH